MNKFKTGILATAMLTAMAFTAHAACPANGATPFYASPVDPANGFAEYVEDSQGLALALCLNPNFCFFDPVVPGNTFSELIGFGAEGFWWLGEATLTTAGGVDAVIVMGAEAAFNTEDPGPGEQFPFTRLRIRVDIAIPGIYTVTHPFGQETYVLPNAGTRVINDSFDIEFMPNAVNQGRVAPWLTWDTFPGDSALDINNDGVDEFIGISGVAHAVKGAPCGNNFFRISAVALDGVTPIAIDPDDQDGDGDTSSITENLFSIQGRVFPGNVETPLSVGGVTYSRNAGGITRLNLHATAPTTATVGYDTTPADGVVGDETAMTGDGLGRFFGTELLGNTPPPATVEVVATNVAQPNNDTAVRTVAVHDQVHVLLATYQTASGTLDVAAESSDLLNHPTLTVVGFGVLGELGTLRASNLNVAPATVTIQSSAGGVTVTPVQVINP